MSVIRSLWSTSVALTLLLAGPAGAQKKKPLPVPAKPAPLPSAYKPLPVQTQFSPCWSVAFSPDGTKLAVGTYRRVLIYEPATGQKLADWSVSTDAIRTLAFSPDGAQLAVGTGVPGTSGAVLVLNTSNGQVLRPLKFHEDTVEAVAFAGNLVISAGNDEKIYVADASTGQKLNTLTEHVGRCLAVAVPPKSATGRQDAGALFATGGADKMFKVWDAKSRRVVVNFDQCQSTVWCVAALPAPGRFVAGSGDGALRVFGVRYETPQQDSETEDAPPTTETSKKAPAARVGFQAQTFGGAHEGGVYAVAAGSNGQTVVSGGADHKVKVWNLGRNRMEQEFAEAKGDIYGVAISPNNQYLAAASLDGHVRLYDLIQNKFLRELP